MQCLIKKYLANCCSLSRSPESLVCAADHFKCYSNMFQNSQQNMFCSFCAWCKSHKSWRSMKNYLWTHVRLHFRPLILGTDKVNNARWRNFLMQEFYHSSPYLELFSEHRSLTNYWHRESVTNAFLCTPFAIVVGLGMPTMLWSLPERTIYILMAMKIYLTFFMCEIKCKTELVLQVGNLFNILHAPAILFWKINP